VYFGNVADALLMEGHGVFVWSAYLFTALVLTIILLGPRIKERKILARLKAEQRRNNAPSQAGKMESNAPGS
jgi:heme exporter protein D